MADCLRALGTEGIGSNLSLFILKRTIVFVLAASFSLGDLGSIPQIQVRRGPSGATFQRAPKPAVKASDPGPALAASRKLARSVPGKPERRPAVSSSRIAPSPLKVKSSKG